MRVFLFGKSFPSVNKKRTLPSDGPSIPAISASSWWMRPNHIGLAVWLKEIEPPYGELVHRWYSVIPNMFLGNLWLGTIPKWRSRKVSINACHINSVTAKITGRCDDRWGNFGKVLFLQHLILWVYAPLLFALENMFHIQCLFGRGSRWGHRSGRDSERMKYTIIDGKAKPWDTWN